MLRLLEIENCGQCYLVKWCRKIGKKIGKKIPKRCGLEIKKPYRWSGFEEYFASLPWSGDCELHEKILYKKIFEEGRRK